MRNVSRLLFALALAAAPPALAHEGGTDHKVDALDSQFMPAEVRGVTGDHVTWTSRSTRPHSVTADDGSFDSHPNCPPACMVSSSTFSFDFTRPGTYRYYCRVHGGRGGSGMSGVVIIEQAQVSDPPATTTSTARPPGGAPTTSPPPGRPARTTSSITTTVAFAGALPGATTPTSVAAAPTSSTSTSVPLDESVAASADEADLSEPRSPSVALPAAVAGLLILVDGLVAWRLRPRR